MGCFCDLCVQYFHVWCLLMLVLYPGVPATRSIQLSYLLWCNSLSLLLLLLLPNLWTFYVWSLFHELLLHLLHLFFISLLCFKFVLFIWLPISFLLFSLQGNTIESEHLSELTEEEYEAHIYQRQDLKGFMWLDAKYLNPFFTRRLTQEVREKSSVLPGGLGNMILLMIL